MKLFNLKNMNILNKLLLSLMFGSLVACAATGRISVDKHSADASADFAQLKTYSWDYSALGKIQPDGSHMPELDRVVCEHVDKIMSENGYTRINAKRKADFTLDYRVTITQEEAAESTAITPDSQSEANDYGLRWTFQKGESPSFKGLQAPKSQTVIYQNGTLHLAAFNNQGEAIWHSSATKILNGRANEAERRAALRIAVNKIMKTFPTK